METKVRVTADSTCDLPVELCERFGIAKIGLWVGFGEKMMQDDGSLSSRDVYDYYAKTGNLTKSAALSIQEYTDFFKRFTDEGYEVVHVNISAELSSTHQNAVLAAQSLPGVSVIDSRHLSSGQGLVAIKCATLAQEGKSAAEIKEIVDQYKHRVSTSFVLDTLQYMARGGRCSAMTAFGANLMKIKPTIIMPDGKLIVGKKYRGKLANCLKEYVSDTLTADREYELDRIFITHSGVDDPQILEDMKAQILSLVPFREVHITQAGITVSTHCGPNTVGILFVTK